ncbi:Transmembrane protein 33 [Porphyridium purpureum]|uniref:Transmembrane protein 33 n=1 Tax=Porphyridium purpureum TaxID=35688 RepID=A0A5J4YNE9_PORPP|nr:Transmembrane protein 33 [Porphyridium purpureum]|eukprot:POR1127..scf222_8
MSASGQAAEAAFATHDFDADARFARFLETATLVASSPEDERVMLRRIYFRKYVNADLPGAPQPPRGAASARSAPAPAETRSNASAWSTQATQSRSAPQSSAHVRGSGGSQWETACYRLLSLLSSPPSKLFFYCFILVTSLLAIIPILGARGWFYGKALLAAAIVYVVGTLNAVGLPQFNREYLERMMQLDHVQYIFFCIAMRGAQPEIVIALFPLIVFSVYGALTAMQTLVQSRFPRYTQQYSVVYARMDRFRGTAQRYVALIELAIVPNILFNAFFSPLNSLLMLFGYLQFLRIRYVKSSFTRSAFLAVDQKCRHLIATYSPGMWPYYDKLCAQLRAMVQAPGAPAQ